MQNRRDFIKATVATGLAASLPFAVNENLQAESATNTEVSKPVFKCTEFQYDFETGTNFAQLRSEDRDTLADKVYWWMKAADNWKEATAHIEDQHTRLVCGVMLTTYEHWFAQEHIDKKWKTKFEFDVDGMISAITNLKLGKYISIQPSVSPNNEILIYNNGQIEKDSLISSRTRFKCGPETLDKYINAEHSRLLHNNAGQQVDIPNVQNSRMLQMYGSTLTDENQNKCWMMMNSKTLEQQVEAIPNPIKKYHNYAKHYAEYSTKYKDGLIVSDQYNIDGILLGSYGSGFWQKSYIWSPYMLMFCEKHNGRNIFYTRSGHKMVNALSYAKISNSPVPFTHEYNLA